MKTEHGRYVPCVYHDHGNVIPTPIIEGVAITAPADWTPLYQSVRDIAHVSDVTFVAEMAERGHAPVVLAPGAYLRRLRDWAAAGGAPVYDCCR